MRAVLVALVLVVLAVVLAACDRDEVASTVATSTPTAAPHAGGVPPPTTAIPTPTPRPGREGVFLIDAETGGVTPLLETDSTPLRVRGFSPDGMLTVHTTTIRDNRVVGGTKWLYGPDGVLAGTSPDDPERCFGGFEFFPVDVLIGGRVHRVECFSFSPDRRFGYYELRPSESRGQRDATYEAWLLRMSDGANQLLTAELRSCGGCDGFQPPHWSPSGRYVVFEETRSIGGRVAYVGDTESRTARSIGPRVAVSLWSPRGDTLIVWDERGGTALLDLPSGTRRLFSSEQLGRRFDRSGRYLYHLVPPRDSLGSPLIPSRETVVVDAETGAERARWAGAPRLGYLSVADYRGTPVGILEEAVSCRGGLMVYHPGLPDGERCVQNAMGGVWSPDSAALAFGRTSGPSFTMNYAGDQVVWNVFEFDIASGAERPIVADFRGWLTIPPLIWWSPDAARLVVESPGPRP